MNRIKMPAELATVEISSICNARCRWCTTGIKNRAGRQEKAQFMTPELFERGLDRLLEIGWVDQDTRFDLYSWGEPFLNPHINEIYEILASRGFRYYLSTNGSVYRQLSPAVIENLEFFMISMPGMSQASYDKIHQLDMKSVHRNIGRFARDLGACGARAKLLLNFHVYQFNLGELEQARVFAERLGGGCFTPILLILLTIRSFSSI